MEQEDLQSVYEGKELKKEFERIPLAADAAHLLSDYLDTLAIELVRKGVLEPYQITSQYEEMLTQELRIKASDNKLTYDVVNRLLEKYGPPVKVVQDYIKENKPVVKPLLIRDATQQEFSHKKGKPVDFSSGLELTIGYAIITLVLSMNIIIIFSIFNTGPGNPADNFVTSIFSALIFIMYELGSGFTGGAAIPIDQYRRVRPYIKTSFGLIATLAMIINFDTGGYSLTGWIVLFTLLVYAVTIIRDHTPIFYAVNPEFNKPVRFILPSYILTYLTVAFALLQLSDIYSQSYLSYGLDDIYSRPYLSYGDYTRVIYISILALITIVIDIRRKYPLSIHRIIILSSVPYFIVRAFSYHDENNGFQERYFVSSDTLFSILFLWVLTYLILTLLVFRVEVSKELDKLREEMRSYKI